MAAERELPPLRVRLFGEDAGFNRFIDNANAKLDNLASKTARVGQQAAADLQRSAGSIALQAGAIGVALGGMVAAPIALAAEFEQTQVAFGVFLGSVEKGNAMLKQLEDMAVRTPFETKDLEKGASLLLGYGVAQKDVMADMEAIGDVSMGNVEKFKHLSLAFGQVQAKGKLMAQEVNQMTEQGFNPLQEIARTTGKTVAEVMEEMGDGNISASMVREAFRTASGEGGRYNDMMEKQSQTLTGLTSTMRDHIGLAMRAVGDAMLPSLKARVQVGIQYAQMVRTWVENHKEFAGAVGMAVLNMAMLASGVAVVAGAVSGLATGYLLVQRALAATISTMRMLTPVAAAGNMALGQVLRTLQAIRLAAIPMLAPLLPYIAIAAAVAAAIGLVALAIWGPEGIGQAWAWAAEMTAAWYDYTMGFLANFTENWGLLVAWVGQNWTNMLYDAAVLFGLFIGAVAVNWVVLMDTQVRLITAFLGWLTVAVPAVFKYVFSKEFIDALLVGFGRAILATEAWLAAMWGYMKAFTVGVVQGILAMNQAIVEAVAEMLPVVKDMVWKVLSGEINIAEMVGQLAVKGAEKVAQVGAAAGQAFVDGAAVVGEQFDKAAQRIQDDFVAGQSDMNFVNTATTILEQQQGKLVNPMDGFVPTTEALPEFNVTRPEKTELEVVKDKQQPDEVMKDALAKKKELEKPMTITAKADFSAVGKGTAEAFDRLQQYADAMAKQSYTGDDPNSPSRLAERRANGGKLPTANGNPTAPMVAQAEAQARATALAQQNTEARANETGQPKGRAMGEKARRLAARRPANHIDNVMKRIEQNTRQKGNVIEVRGSTLLETAGTA